VTDAGAPGGDVGAPSEDAVRAEARAWLESAWDPDLSLLEWRRAVVAAGWMVPAWPRAWFGQDLPTWSERVGAEERRAVGAVGPPLGGGMALAAPTILARGSAELRRLLLEPILTGAATWCQLFSEPGAGSDLAGLTTRAERDGDEWIVTGQKVWTTSAHHADFGMLLARTDWDVPKHRGLTYFALPMHQPGIEVRPLRQMNDHASFNEVFLDGARVPADHVIGDVGGGWAVALTTLAHERRYGALVGERGIAAGPGRASAEYRAEADAHERTYRWYPQRAGRPDLLAPLAAASGRDAEALVRQEVSAVDAMARTSGWTAERARVARALGRPPGAEGSLGKLAMSRVAKAAAIVHGHLAGAAGMLARPDAPGDGVVAEVLVSTPAQSIAGGTDEIQKTIVAERMLGLPREPQPDRDLPFREVARPPGR